MIKIAKFFLLFFFVFCLTSCGTREYLGFEKKKIRLEGKRVSILKERTDVSIEKKSSVDIILEDAVILQNWQQSYNSPSHLSLNYASDSRLESFRYLISGAGEGKKSKILSQPVIYDDLIFFLDAKSNVISFSLRKNKIVWTRNISIKNESNHDIGGGIGIFKSSLIINSPYGQIISLDMFTGEKKWEIDVDSSIRSAPTISDNKVLSLTSSNKLYVLNAVDGNLLWQHQGIFNNTTLIDSPKVAVDENIIIVPYSNGEFFALNLNNGKEIWRSSFIDVEVKETTNAFSDIDAFPVIKKDIVIITSAIGKLFAINKKNGNKLWTRDISSTQTPLVNGNSIFIVNKNKEIICLNILDGGTKWTLAIDDDLSNNKKYIWFSPVLINGKLVLVGGNQKLIVIDTFSGVVNNIKNIPNFPVSSPIIVNKIPYLMLRNGDIIKIE